jgi:hypothetical protein
MSAPVDVLEVLDAQQVAAFERGDTDAARTIGATRVAVAELIEAADHAALWIEDSALPAMDDPDGGNGLLVGLRAALARCGGAS